MSKKEQFLPIYIGNIKRYEVHISGCNISVIDLECGKTLSKKEILDISELREIIIENIDTKVREHLVNTKL